MFGQPDLEGRIGALRLGDLSSYTFMGVRGPQINTFSDNPLRQGEEPVFVPVKEKGERRQPRFTTEIVACTGLQFKAREILPTKPGEHVQGALRLQGEKLRAQLEVVVDAITAFARAATQAICVVAEMIARCFEDFDADVAAQMGAFPWQDHGYSIDSEPVKGWPAGVEMLQSLVF